MHVYLLTCLLGGILVLRVEGTRRCRKEKFAERLGRYPDAWRILENTSQQFFLAFVSNKSAEVDSELRCLHTISRRKDHSKPWMTNLVYGFTKNGVIQLSGIVKVGISKTDDTYLFDNAFNTTYKEEVKKWEFEDRFEESEIIYTDFSTCLVMYSRLFGYQVWITGRHPSEKRGIPYLCTFIYESCAGRKKYWAYNWKTCHRIRHESGGPQPRSIE